MALSRINGGATAGYSYGYDQLNRLVEMRQHATGTSSGWSNSDIITAYRESIAYDANGNILKYLRHGAADETDMDSLNYHYHRDGEGYLVNNKLNHVKDAVNGANYTVDIDDQDEDNYEYDLIGNLKKDKNDNPTQRIKNIDWTVYGKIKHIEKGDDIFTTGDIEYGYDAGGNRTYKVFTLTDVEKTFYIRDAQGNVLAVYSKKNSDPVRWDEQHLYGSSRLGLWRWDTLVPASPPVVDEEPIYDSILLGSRTYELSNHLGNVLATISDKKIGVDEEPDDETDYYIAEVLSQTDYYPFGMGMPGKKFSPGSYRYGFNGYENDNEVKGEGNSVDFGSRIYDPRIARWLSLDPLQKKYPGESHYGFVSGNPILYKDADGKDKIITITIIQKDGTMTQIQKVDKSYFVYHADQTMYSGMQYTKADLKQSIIIDLRSAEENISSPENIIKYSEEEVNIQDISWWQYSVFSDIGDFFSTGDNSDKVAYGYRIYGRGHDMEWQSGLPTAAPGTESIDMEDWFGLARNISPNSSPGEMFGEMIKKVGRYTGKDMQQVLAALNIIVKSTEATTEATLKTLDIIERLKEASKNLPASEAVCPACRNKQDSTHIDDVNGKGTFEKLKGTGTDSINKKVPEKNKNP